MPTVYDPSRKETPVYVVGTPLGTAGDPLTVSTGASPLPAGTDRSGTAGTTATQLAPANSGRLALTGQNISTGTIGINEAGGTAAIGSAGTYTIAAGQAFAVSTNRAISIIGSAAGLAYSATEV